MMKDDMLSSFLSTITSVQYILFCDLNFGLRYMLLKATPNNDCELHILCTFSLFSRAEAVEKSFTSSSTLLCQSLGVLDTV